MFFILSFWNLSPSPQYLLVQIRAIYLQSIPNANLRSGAFPDSTILIIPLFFLTPGEPYLVGFVTEYWLPGL